MMFRNINVGYLPGIGGNSDVIISFTFDEDLGIFQIPKYIESNLFFDYLRSTKDISYYEPFTRSDIKRINKIAFMWNNNHRRRGTDAQMGCLYRARFLSQPKRMTLANHDLLIDHGYEYNSELMFVEVPDDVLEYIFSLPGEGTPIEDVRSYIENRNGSIDLDVLQQILA